MKPFAIIQPTKNISSTNILPTKNISRFVPSVNDLTNSEFVRAALLAPLYKFINFNAVLPEVYYNCSNNINCFSFNLNDSINNLSASSKRLHRLTRFSVRKLIEERKNWKRRILRKVRVSNRNINKLLKRYPSRSFYCN